MMKKTVKRICVAQIGARRHYAVIRALEKADMLGIVFTDIYGDTKPQRFLKKYAGGLKRWAYFNKIWSRVVPGLPASKIKTFPLFALSRFLQSNQSSIYRFWARRNSKFCKIAVARRELRACDGVYVYNGAGLELLEASVTDGMVKIVDQTSAPLVHDVALLQEEHKRWPEWQQGAIDEDSWKCLAAREETEWALADLIVTGSDYVKEALECKGAEKKCVVIPYGHDAIDAVEARKRIKGRPLRVLFVGTLELRKGIPYLVETAKLLERNSFEFRLVGENRLTDKGLQKVREVAEYWGAVSRDRVVEAYDWADVFFLPTISEGSANVVFEAMTRGLPVVTTPHAGSIIQHGHDGLLCPIRAVEDMADALRLLSDNGEVYERLSRAALESVGCYTIDLYAERLVAAIEEAKKGE